MCRFSPCFSISFHIALRMKTWWSIHTKKKEKQKKPSPKPGLAGCTSVRKWGKPLAPDSTHATLASVFCPATVENHLQNTRFERECLLYRMPLHLLMHNQVQTCNKCRTKMLQRDSMKLGNSLKRKRHQPRDIEEFKKKCSLQKPNTNRREDPKIEGGP